ncbi:MAG TPA: ATP-binding cassette domain-containing protein [Solirubrobacteraceae bacterium]|nr:ATP-binding cassette domain-containing protein [Solirubrobacteraceae bacterium]
MERRGGGGARGDLGGRRAECTVIAVALRDVFCVHRTAEGDAAALQGATMSVTAGEVVAVIGRSGAGKTTLLRTIAGLQTPSAGAVEVFGRDIGRLGERARARLRSELIGFLGQRAEAALSPALRVREAVALPLALRGIPAGARVDELLDAVGLRDRAEALPGQLSGGERQRVALCAALAHRPQLLLADEPTAELDAAGAEAVYELIGRLARAAQITAIVVSHDPATAAIADRTIAIRDGRVAEEGLGTLVVAPGGWVRLPPKLLGAAGIGNRARVRHEPGGLLISPTDPQPAKEPDEPVPVPAGWTLASIKLTNIARIRGRPVLVDVTNTFGPGGLIAVAGPSGSGKTTLLRLLAGLDLPEAGEVSIDGIRLGDPEQRAELRRTRIGYLPQEPAPVGFLTARENVALALALRGLPADDRALERVGLGDRAGQRVARLSAGEAQRVALARALACARGLLILDEPTSRLDEAAAAAVGRLLRVAAGAHTVVCATHDPELLGCADEIVHLK